MVQVGDAVGASEQQEDRELGGARTVVGRTPNEIIWRRFRTDRVAFVGFIIIVFVTLVALGAPLISGLVGHGPRQSYVFEMTGDFGVPKGPTLSSPAGMFLFGADAVARDLLVRIAYGLRTSLQVALIATAVSTALGVTLGILAGYYRGKVDAVISRLTDVFFTLPTLLLMLGINAACGAQPKGQECLGGLLKPGIPVLVFVLTVFGWPYLTRVIRGQVLSLREKEFVEAARSLGASDLNIMVHHILPNVLGTIIVIATLTIPSVVLVESGLSFLGLGLPPTVPSLGGQIDIASGIYRVAWWSMAFPGLALIMLTIGFNLVGDALRDAFDPRTS
jgi:ABC-type dipeptide/oligopeptide/nickel transport system permease subunit